jgi:hypothetical protein
VLPAVPIGCASLAIAACELVNRARLRRVAIALVLAAQLGASVYLAYHLRAFKERMATHRERIRAATAEGALVAGPAEWSKLFFARDGNSVRRYASYGRSGEAVRLVDEAVRSGRRRTSSARAAVRPTTSAAPSPRSPRATGWSPSSTSDCRTSCASSRCFPPRGRLRVRRDSVAATPSQAENFC